MPVERYQPMLHIRTSTGALLYIRRPCSVQHRADELAADPGHHLKAGLLLDMDTACCPRMLRSSRGTRMAVGFYSYLSLPLFVRLHHHTLAHVLPGTCAYIP